MPYESLLKELFLGEIEVIREQLRPLPESTREILYKKFAPLLKALRGLLKQPIIDLSKSRWIRIKFYDPSLLYQIYQTDPEAFLKLEWTKEFPYREHKVGTSITDIEGTNLWQQECDQHSNKLILFLARLRSLEVGLGTQRAAENGLKRSFRNLSILNSAWGSTHYAKIDRSALSLGRILLDREVAWKESIFWKLCEKITSWQEQYCNGFAELLLEAGERFPAWLPQLQSFYGKAMVADGFLQPQWSQRFSAEMIIAGFDTRELPPNNYGTGLAAVAVTQEWLVPDLFKLFETGKLSRQPFIEITIREILSPQKPTILQIWCKFFERLALSDQEMFEYRYSYIDLVNSQLSEVVQLGIKGLTELLRKGALNAEEILPPLTLALNNQHQVAALSALQLIKRIVDENNNYFESVAANLIDALASPHKKLRLTIIKLLKQQQKNLTSLQLDQLAEIFPILSISEQAELKPLLSQVSNESAITAITTITTSPQQDQHQQLAALTKQISALNGINKKLTHWHDFLQGYLNTPDSPPQLLPLKGDLTYALKHDFTLYQSAEELALALFKNANNHLSLLDNERLLEGILRFRDDVSNERVKNLIEPVINPIKQQVESGHNIANILIQGSWLLVALWYGVLTFSQPTKDVKQPLLGVSSFSTIIWLERVKNALNWLKKGIRAMPLSIPTNNAGWIDPIVFAKRFMALEIADIDLLDLRLALYRLPNIVERRASAWELVRERVKGKQTAVEQIICLVLGDDDTSKESLNWFTKYFQQNRPSMAMYQAIHITEDGWKYATKQYFATENMVFQAFYAALRSKYGFGDLRAIMAEIPTSRLKWDDFDLMYSSGAKPEWIKARKELETKLLQSVVDNAFFYPELITQAGIKKIELEDYTLHYICNLTTVFPPLLPYLFILERSFYPLYGPAYDEFPAGIQRMFEASIVKLLQLITQGSRYNYAISTTVTLIDAGKLPHVEISQYSLTHLAQLLVLKNVDVRERIVTLLAIWLEDGRCTPGQVALTIAEVWRQCTKGYLYLIDALTSLAAASRAGNRIVLLTIEKFLSFLTNGIEDVATKKLTMMLQRLESLIVTTGEIRDPLAIAALKKLATIKATKDLANAILANLTGRSVIPLEVEIIAELIGSEVNVAI